MARDFSVYCDATLESLKFCEATVSTNVIPTKMMNFLVLITQMKTAANHINRSWYDHKMGVIQSADSCD